MTSLESLYTPKCTFVPSDPALQEALRERTQAQAKDKAARLAYRLEATVTNQVATMENRVKRLRQIRKEEAALANEIKKIHPGLEYLRKTGDPRPLALLMAQRDTGWETTESTKTVARHYFMDFTGLTIETDEDLSTWVVPTETTP